MLQKRENAECKNFKLLHSKAAHLTCTPGF